MLAKRYFVRFSICLVAALLIGGGSGAARAQSEIAAGPLPPAKPAAAFCDRAETTADFQACLKKRVDDAQARLNEVVARIEGAALMVSPVSSAQEQGESPQPRPVTPDELKIMRDNQKSWLAYRDSQCEWEKSRAEAALSRIEELACLADLTEERVARLATLYWKDNSEDPREFGTLERWMNMVAYDNPDVFWRYYDVRESDLDCNGIPEKIMPGLRMNKEGSATIMMALAENPATGRPTIYTASLPVQLTSSEETPEDVSWCGVDFSMEIITDEEGQSDKSCPSRLVLTGTACPPVSLLWNGKHYQWQKDAK